MIKLNDRWLTPGVLQQYDLKTLYQKIIRNIDINSNEDKLYIKIVALDAIYNFVVEKLLN